jgi:hypothetical protein
MIRQNPMPLFLDALQLSEQKFSNRASRCVHHHVRGRIADRDGPKKD